MNIIKILKLLIVIFTIFLFAACGRGGSNSGTTTTIEEKKCNNKLIAVTNNEGALEIETCGKKIIAKVVDTLNNPLEGIEAKLEEGPVGINFLWFKDREEEYADAIKIFIDETEINVRMCLKEPTLVCATKLSSEAEIFMKLIMTSLGNMTADEIEAGYPDAMAVVKLEPGVHIFFDSTDNLYLKIEALLNEMGGRVFPIFNVSSLKVGSKKLLFLNAVYPFCTDNDKDGHAAEGGQCGPADCDDNDPSINPNMAEICDGVDNDCNGDIDEENVCIVICTDYDGDGYAVEGNSCGEIDCDDTRSDVNPGAEEECDWIDHNCDGNTYSVGVCDR